VAALEVAMAVVRLDRGELEAAQRQEPADVLARLARMLGVALEDRGRGRGAGALTADAGEVLGVGELDEPAEVDGGLADRPDLPVDERAGRHPVEEDVAQAEVAVDDGGAARLG